MIQFNSIEVHASQGNYPIYVGYHLLKKPELFENVITKKQVFILSHPQVASHYLSTLERTCYLAGADKINHYLIPSGEKNKNLKTANQIWNNMLSQSLHRDAVVISLGGGVIGDLAGFCSAVYMRGVRLIQCPTTLLAQIDASIGGKTGINLPEGKNLIGAFHAPQVVVADLETLTSLEKREFVAGIAEIIKYGITLDKDLFIWLENNINLIKERQPEILRQMITRACQIKAHVVSKDEKEKGSRIVLNFGHTIAHALESLLDYQQIRHGEAVSVGMIVAAHLSLQKGNLSPIVLERLISLLKAFDLPTTLPSISISKMMNKLNQDKKHRNQQLNWVLLKDLGKTRIDNEVTSEQIISALIQMG